MYYSEVLCTFWFPLSNQLTGSLGFLAFYLYADTCASDYMNQDNYNKELQHLECMHFYSYASHGT